MNACQFCGVDTSNPKYCSLSCGAKNQPRSQMVRLRECVECKDEFDAGREKHKKFCSRSCSATFNNRKYPKRVAETPRITVCARVACSKDLDLSKTQSKYCSASCGVRHRSEFGIALWLSGEWDGTTKTGLSQSIKNYLKKQAEYRCQAPGCAYPGGWSEINPTTGRVPVEVDHIDGNYLNNRPENLIVICPSCHALTPNFKSLNKGNGRHGRRQRYAEGKSF